MRRRGRAAQRERARRGETREGGAEGECGSDRAAWRAFAGGAAKAESEPEKRPRLRRAGGLQMERGGEGGTERERFGESGAENDAR